MKKLFILSTLLLNACMNSAPAPTTQYFSLYSSDITQSQTNTNAIQIRLIPISVNQQFNSSHFVFRTNKHQYKTDPYNQLMTTPSEQIYQYVLGQMSQQEKFRLVATNNLTTSRYLLQLDIEKLYSDFQDPASPFSTITVTATLYQNNNGDFELAARKQFTEFADISSSQAIDVIAGYDTMLQKVNNDLIEFITNSTKVNT
jgi:uncharacterized lipoprotein YmbA